MQSQLLYYYVIGTVHSVTFQCTVDNNEGEFHRKKKISENEDSIPKSDPFTSEQRLVLNILLQYS